MADFSILYGSETGTAQDVAELIWREATHRGYKASLRAMDEVDIATLAEEKLVIFVLSTTGQGQEPSNMRTFWKSLLRRSLPNSIFHQLHFAVLGLGDSSYEKFNFAAKKLYRRLEQLGAKILVPLGLADDQHQMGIDGVCDPWVAGLWQSVSSVIGAPHSFSTQSNTGRYEPKVSILFESTDLSFEECHTATQPQTLQLTVKENQRVTAGDHFQDTRLISFNLSPDFPSYHPGDVLMVMPQNLNEIRDEFCDLLAESGHDVLRLFAIKKNQTGTVLAWPTGWTNLRYCTEKFWDIQSVPRRSFFRLLSTFATDERERERLAEFASPEGIDDLYSYCNRPRRNILEVLMDFKRTFVNVPMEYLFDLLPQIRPRAFSIASNCLAHPGVVQILVAVVNYRTKLARLRRGLCSTWLSRLEPGESASVWLRTGTIKFPASKTVCIMVGPGTGVAPFRNFIAGRVLNKMDGNLLFFGCRNAMKDFYFREEWESCCEQKLMELVTAFSRDQKEKIYVQDRIVEMGQHIWELISHENANFLIAGSAKEMPTAVKNALVKCFEDFGKLSHNDAQEYLNQMEKRNRFQSETWS